MISSLLMSLIWFMNSWHQYLSLSLCMELLLVKICIVSFSLNGEFKSPGRFDSYRAIAGASHLLKLFKYVILHILGNVLSTDSLQFGFKAEMSTIQCSWLVNKVSNYFMRRFAAVNTFILDCSKAFDKCRFDKLFT